MSQIITQASKRLIFILLSCLLLIIMENNNILMDLPSNQNRSTSVFQDNSIWNEISLQFQLDHQTDSSRVQKEIKKLLADQERLYHILETASPYIYYIFQQTKASGLPAELALIPFIESEFNPNDHSNKGALGLWQLMRQTAKDLGVTVNSGYDGRRNIIASTHAALVFFRDLASNFHGDWNLAIAAYNCGPFCVEKAIRRTGQHSYWNLPLPKDTKYYVPRLLAVASIIENPEKYGLQLPPVQNHPYFTTIRVNKPIALEKIAKTSGISIQELKALNPDHKKIIPLKKGTDTLLIPTKHVAIVQQKIASHLI